LHVDVAAVAANQLARDVETEAGALSDRLRREERIEDATTDRFGNTRTIVENADDDEAWPWNGGEGDLAPTRQCVDRIVDQIGDGLPEQLAVGADENGSVGLRPELDAALLRDLRERAQQRVDQLQSAGESRAYLYGADEKMLGGLNSFYLLVDKPDVYGLPPDPKLPTRNLVPGSVYAVLGAIMAGLAGIFHLRDRGAREP